jgi:glyoxylase-like metal-dependent hydrolase (beta-lactamase superfamily II)
VSVMPIGERWFTRQPMDDAITLLAEQFTDPLIRCNIWHVQGRHQDLVIDTGLGIVSLRQELSEMTDRPVVAVATHGHFDHIGGLYEFDERVGHAADLPPDRALTTSPLVAAGYSQQLQDVFTAAGYPIADPLLHALPSDGFDPAAFRQRPMTLTRLVGEGDVIDLGDRAFEVLHLPGHSPGSIALWDAGRGVLFSGDTVYDGGLLDTLPGSDISRYIESMERLRALPVSVVHGGHEPSFGRSRLLELIDGYLAAADAVGAAR